jgi:hypothetical protein
MKNSGSNVLNFSLPGNAAGMTPSENNLLINKLF